MDKLAIWLYNWFDRHKSVFYFVLVSLFVLFGFLAFRLRFNENISSFFGDNKESEAVFDNIRIKDRIIVMVSGEEPDTMIDAGEAFADSMQVCVDEGLIRNVVRGVDEDMVDKSAGFIYDYLPVFLNENDYDRLESILNADSVSTYVRGTYNILMSPSGIVVKDILLRDPLGIGTHLMRNFEKFSRNIDYEIYSGHIFTKDMKTMLLFISPSHGMGSTGDNDRLVSELEAKAAAVQKEFGTKVESIGGPIVAVYNARQIKKDTAITLTIALIIIILFILFSFRRRRTVPLIVVPPFFGAVFSLAVISLIKGGISAIAIGAGSVVIGISLSYSIHFVAHGNHTHDPRQIISDLIYPMTIGSFTTIGAFAALMFTSSPLLRDMGLFSVFALIGTALFCIVFLPHFMKSGDGSGEEKPLFRLIEKINNIPYHKIVWATGIISVLTLAGLFLFNRVEFDSNLSDINYMPEHIVEAESRLNKDFVGAQSGILVGSSAKNISDASDSYIRLDSLLNELVKSGEISDYLSVKELIVDENVQEARINRWNEFWASRRHEVKSWVGQSAAETGLKPEAFSAFYELLDKDFQVCQYGSDEIDNVPALSDWINPMPDATLILSRINIAPENKEKVYSMIEKIGGATVIDRAYFSSKMVEDTSNDFNFILLISSIIVFVALLLSYGRLELALLSFLPMCISWIIILGLMAVLGIRFNIVNVILATFIFGIGDDFSIFIMDGLMQEYKDGKKMLGAHRTAIFFSAFTTIVGMGVLIFAKHPALKSIAVISVLGLLVVVFVSYTVQVFLFREFISKPTEKGGFPFTFGRLIITIYSFVYFLIGCIVAQLFRLILLALPMNRERKKLLFCKLLHCFAKLFLKTIPGVRNVEENPHNEDFTKPSIIISNHQSFVDILVMLAKTPKIIMLTNSWVWNSPFFGKIVQFADYYHTDDGYEGLVDRLKEKVSQGYSILVFPEGTRSADCSILRFHKGAFYLANQMQLDIVPVIIYGTGMVCSKTQGFYIKRGLVALEICKRVASGSSEYGDTYQLMAKNFRQFYIREFADLSERHNNLSNPYFRSALIKNYIYKGPVLEWYMRVKTRIDGNYNFWDKIVPENARVTDVGCGYGQMCFALAMLSPGRKVYGIDYDEDKILMASNSFLARNPNIDFESADMRMHPMPQTDVFIFNDSLHYVDEKSQEQTLLNCLSSLSENGMMLVRDGDASNAERHKKILKTEKWSTKIMGFNRTTQELTFVSRYWMTKFAESNGLSIKIMACDDSTSETLYILKRKQNGK